MLVLVVLFPMLKLLVLKILMFLLLQSLISSQSFTTRDNVQEQSFRPVNTINEQV